MVIRNRNIYTPRFFTHEQFVSLRKNLNEYITTGSFRARENIFDTYEPFLQAQAKEKVKAPYSYDEFLQRSRMLLLTIIENCKKDSKTLSVGRITGILKDIKPSNTDIIRRPKNHISFDKLSEAEMSKFVSDEVAEYDNKQHFNYLINLLPERTRIVVEERIKGGTLKDIGEMFDLTAESIRNILYKAIETQLPIIIKSNERSVSRPLKNKY